MILCKKCNGSGEYVVEWHMGSWKKAECEECDGMGQKEARIIAKEPIKKKIKKEVKSDD